MNSDRSVSGSVAVAGRVALVRPGLVAALAEATFLREWLDVVLGVVGVARFAGVVARSDEIAGRVLCPAAWRRDAGPAAS